MTEHPQAIHESFEIVDVPLNKLKKSPRNARRTPHAAADTEALAASMAVKGVLQAPVVEPETDEADAQFAGERHLSVDSTLNSKAERYVLPNAYLACNSREVRWSIAAWIHNIGDEAVHNGAF